LTSNLPHIHISATIDREWGFVLSQTWQPLLKDVKFLRQESISGTAIFVLCQLTALASDMPQA
jgi:hypothetical protein